MWLVLSDKKKKKKSATVALMMVRISAVPLLCTIRRTVMSLSVSVMTAVLMLRNAVLIAEQIHKIIQMLLFSPSYFLLYWDLECHCLLFTSYEENLQ